MGGLWGWVALHGPVRVRYRQWLWGVGRRSFLHPFQSRLVGGWQKLYWHVYDMIFEFEDGLWVSPGGSWVG